MVDIDDEVDFRGGVLLGRVRDDPVEVVSYDARWPAKFKRMRTKLAHALGTDAVHIEHVGSTAVPGLAAKPIIDIQVSVPDVEDEEAYRPAIRAAALRCATGRRAIATSGRHRAGRASFRSTSARSARSGSATICCSATSCATAPTRLCATRRSRPTWPGTSATTAWATWMPSSRTSPRRSLGLRIGRPAQAGRARSAPLAFGSHDGLRRGCRRLAPRRQNLPPCIEHVCGPTSASEPVPAMATAGDPSSGR